MLGSGPHASEGDASIRLVPTISVFYGIVVRMFVKDHPPPHFHVRYGEYHARVAIDTGDVLDGRLPAAG